MVHGHGEGECTFLVAWLVVFASALLNTCFQAIEFPI